MASDQSFADYVKDQLAAAGDITLRKMFGEYALYCNGKVVALICDNQLFVKPTQAGRAYIGQPLEAAPYKGAKPHFLIDEQLENKAYVSELVQLTFNELPLPKPKKASPSSRKKQSPK